VPDHQDLAAASGARRAAPGSHQPARLVPRRKRRPARGSPNGFWLACSICVAGLTGGSLGAITEDAMRRDGVTSPDPQVMAWAVAHRTAMLTGAMKLITWLGSAAVIIPAGLVIGLAVALRRHRCQPLALLAAAVAGAIGLYHLIKDLIGRPPARGDLDRALPDGVVPSGHATQAAAFLCALVIVRSGGRSARVKATLRAAALVTLAVGAARVYLGAHWLSDVLGGYPLGGAALWRRSPS
jgi:membrane-associated phospholipid phosphatase